MNTLPRVKKRKGKKMKKMILTMVAMLSMTAAFAEGEKTAEVSNLEAYELNINMNKLSKALGEVRSRVWQRGSRRDGEACHLERC